MDLDEEEVEEMAEVVEEAEAEESITMKQEQVAPPQSFLTNLILNVIDAISLDIFNMNAKLICQNCIERNQILLNRMMKRRSPCLWFVI